MSVDELERDEDAGATRASTLAAARHRLDDAGSS